MSSLQVGNNIIILILKDERTRLEKPYGRDKIFVEFHKSTSLTGKIREINGNDCLVEFGEYNRRTDEFKSFGFKRTFPIEYLMEYSKKII